MTNRTAAFRARGRTITVTLPPDAHAELQALCDAQGLSQREALTRLLLGARRAEQALREAAPEPQT
jgi:hypothetical protein